MMALMKKYLSMFGNADKIATMHLFRLHLVLIGVSLNHIVPESSSSLINVNRIRAPFISSNKSTALVELHFELQSRAMRVRV